MNVVGEKCTIINFKWVLSMTRHFYFFPFSVYFPTLWKSYFTLLSHHTSNTPMFSIHPLQPMTLPHIFKKIEALFLELTPASLLDQPSTEKWLLSMSQWFYLAKYNGQFSVFILSTYQQNLSRMIMPSTLASPRKAWQRQSQGFECSWFIWGGDSGNRRRRLRRVNHERRNHQFKGMLFICLLL